MMSKRKRGLCAAINVLAIIAALAIFEIIGQDFIFKDKMYFAKDVDHRLKPNSSPEINSDGIRSLVKSGHFREEDLNIIFLGDSFLYGTRLPFNKTITYRFEEIAGKSHPAIEINAANFAWISSSPLLSYRLLKDIGRKYNPDIVILALDMSDFHEEIKYLRLLERKGIYRLLDIIPITVLAARRLISQVEVLEPLHERIFRFPSRRFFITEKPLSETLPYFSYVKRSIDNINTFCKTELDARFMLVILPRSYQYSDRESPDNWEKKFYEPLGKYVHEPFKYFESIRNEVDYHIYSLLPDFQASEVFPTCFDDDPHWNEAGAAVAAEAIYGYCLKEGCFE